MSQFPESIDPDKYQQLAEKLSMDVADYEFLEYVRRQMRYILSEEQKEKDNE